MLQTRVQGIHALRFSIPASFFHFLLFFFVLLRVLYFDCFLRLSSISMTATMLAYPTMYVTSQNKEYEHLAVLYVSLSVTESGWYIQPSTPFFFLPCSYAFVKVLFPMHIQYVCARNKLRAEIKQQVVMLHCLSLCTTGNGNVKLHWPFLNSLKTHIEVPKNRVKRKTSIS